MYTASKDRYVTMEYSHCGNSGLMLPKVSLGLWHNFGDTANFENMKQLCFTAFDNGIAQDLTWRIIMDRSREVRRRILARFLRKTWEFTVMS